MNKPSNVHILKCCFLCIALVTLQTASLAQDTLTPTNYYVQHLDSDDGLLNDQFNAFVNTDSKGFHWIASSNGVYRFDGKTFTNYLPQQDSLQALVQSNFFEDTLGRIWFSTIDALNCYDYKTDAVTSEVFAKAPNNFPPAYHILHYKSKRHEFLVSNGQDLWSYRPKESRTTTKLGSTKSIKYLPLTRQKETIILGFPWLLGPGIERFVLQNGQVVDYSWSADSQLKETQVSGGIQDQHGRIWLGTNKGLLHYDLARDTVLGIYPSPDPSLAEVWSPVLFEGKIAVSTNQSGVWLFDPESLKYIQSVSDEIIPTGDDPNLSPRALHVSPEGLLFAMCRNGGVDVYHPTKNTAQQLFNSKGEPLDVSAMDKSLSDGLWISTKKGDLLHFSKTGKLVEEYEKFFDEKNPILKLRTTAIKSQILAHTSSSLYGITGNNDNRIKRVDTLASFEQQIEGFTITTDGSPMIRTRNAWYKVESNKVRQIHHRILDISSPNDIIDIGNSHYAFSPADRWVYFFTIANNQLTILDSIPSTGTIWDAQQGQSEFHLLATTNGIVATSPDKNIELAEKEVYDFAILNNEPYVALTSSGLMLKNRTKQWQKLGKEIGLTGSFNDESTLILNQDQVWIGSSRGLYRLNLPSTEDSIRKNPQPYITRTWINDRLWAGGLLLNQDSLTLDYNENTIEVDVSVLHTFNSATPTLIYRLAGYQDHWAKLRGENSIRFTQVPPGVYTLEIALDSSAPQPAETTSILVTIEPPFWQTWWFYALAVITSIGLVASVVGVIYRAGFK